MRKKCSSVRKKLLGLQPQICKIFEITRTIYSSSESSEQFLVTECLEQLEFKLEKIIGSLKHAGKVRKIHRFVFIKFVKICRGLDNSAMVKICLGMLGIWLNQKVLCELKMVSNAFKMVIR